MASAAIRADGSSRFGKNIVGDISRQLLLQWRISGEDFFQNAKALSFIDDLKIRPATVLPVTSR